MSQSNYNPTIDILKFVLSVFVVMIHSSFLDVYLYPWLRIAVPLFFIISSYFLFSKLNKTTEKSEKKKILSAFVSRNMKLYLFWFVALLPMTLYIRKWFSGEILPGILKMLQSFLFSSTFVSSWYIIALVIAVLTVHQLSKFFRTETIFALTSIIYIIVTIRSSYFFAIEQIQPVSTIYNACVALFCEPQNNFVVGLFWVSCGKMFAEKRFDFSVIKSIFILIPSIVLLFAEWYFIKRLSGAYRNDCYLFLAPLCISAFTLILKINISTPPRKIGTMLRKMSTIIYALHGSVTPVIVKLCKIAGIQTTIFPFFLIMIICIICCFIIFRLEKYKHFHFLKYSY